MGEGGRQRLKPGERDAAEAALTRLEAPLTELGGEDAPVETPSSRLRFKDLQALSKRIADVTLRAPCVLADQVYWPKFHNLDAALAQYVEAATQRIIRAEVHRGFRQAARVKTPPPRGR